MTPYLPDCPKYVCHLCVRMVFPFGNHARRYEAIQSSCRCRCRLSGFRGQASSGEPCCSRTSRHSSRPAHRFGSARLGIAGETLSSDMFTRYRASEPRRRERDRREPRLRRRHRHISLTARLCFWNLHMYFHVALAAINERTS